MTLKEAVLGGKVKVPTPEGAGDADRSRRARPRARCCASRAAASPARDGKRGDQLVNVEIDLPAADPELQKFAESWDGGGNPRANLGV